jgi:hypothetical protein
VWEDRKLNVFPATRLKKEKTLDKIGQGAEIYPDPTIAAANNYYHATVQMPYSII